MTNKTDCQKLAEAAGLVFDYSPGDVANFPTLALYAPLGKVFNTSGCHCDFSIQGTYGKRALPWRQTFKEIEAIIAAGLGDCPDMPDCDYCNE